MQPHRDEPGAPTADAATGTMNTPETAVPRQKPGPGAAAAGGGAPAGQTAQRSVVDSSVRVDVELLDSLMRLVGELVLARNQLVSRLDDTTGHT
ncbi:MAG TPA: hypothetical protein VFP72_14955, partial [Kineosporiaceae bacterium]|nr:hypothetical protein [Kineosporiaceae bacterium]